MQVWRRSHSIDLVANITQVDSRTYIVTVWNTSSDTGCRLAREFCRLESAKAAADDLVRRNFDHRCCLEDCGKWTVWMALPQVHVMPFT
jgi:hypothetical protein